LNAEEPPCGITPNWDDGHHPGRPGERSVAQQAATVKRREAAFAMPALAFTLHTTFVYFDNWLRHRTEEVNSRHFPTEEGYIQLQPIRRIDEHVGLYTIGMDGFHYTLKDDAERPSPLGPVMLFEVISISDERIQVTPKCVHPAVEGYYFEELLKDISLCWPESREAIKAEIDRLTSRQVQTEPPTPAGDDTDDEEVEAPSMPDWMPKKAKTLKRWKEMYPLWLEMKQEYRGRWDEWEDTDTPEPSLNDFRDRIISSLGWKYSTRRLRDVIEAGRLGYLE